MTRKPLELGYITNDTTRKATFNKRKKGIVKKAEEITTLCGTEACVVMYPPASDTPEVWPSDEVATRLLSEFRESPNVAQRNQVLNPRSCLRESLGKSFQALQKHCEKNRERALTRVMYHNLSGKIGLESLRLADLKDLWLVIDQKQKDLHDGADMSEESDSD